MDRFFDQSEQTIHARYYLLADDLNEKFTDQTDEDFQAMKDEMTHVIQTVESRGGLVLRGDDEVVKFADQIDQKLPQMADAGKC